MITHLDHATDRHGQKIKVGDWVYSSYFGYIGKKVMEIGIQGRYEYITTVKIDFDDGQTYWLFESEILKLPSNKSERKAELMLMMLEG